MSFHAVPRSSARRQRQRAARRRQAGAARHPVGRGRDPDPVRFAARAAPAPRLAALRAPQLHAARQTFLQLRLGGDVRDVPHVDERVRPARAAAAGRPDFAHVILATAADVPERDPRSLERALYLYRRTLSGLWDRDEEFYIASCSHKTVVYKGMVQSSALKKFYLDLANELYVSQFAIYHRADSASV